MSKQNAKTYIESRVADSSNITAQEVREAMNKLLDQDYFEPSVANTAQIPVPVGGYSGGETAGQLRETALSTVLEQILFQAERPVQSAVVNVSSQTNAVEITQLNMSGASKDRLMFIEASGVDHVLNDYSNVNIDGSLVEFSYQLSAGNYRVILIR